MDDERLGNDVFHSHSGIERAERVLKDDLHVAAKAAHFPMVCRAEVVTLDMQIEKGKVKAYRAKVKVSFKYEPPKK